MTGFGSAELGMATQLFIAQMDREGTKIRRDEWEFGGGLGIRISYAHHEQRIHLLHNREIVDTISVNLGTTDPRFPSLDEALDILRNKVAKSAIDAAVHRPGE